MSFVADFIGGAVEAVGNVVDSVASAVGNVVDSIGSNPLAAVAAAALAFATSGASLAAEGVVAAGDAAAYVAAADTAGAVMSVDAFAPVASSTLDIYTGATAAAVNTSVADYAAAAVAGTETGAATAFTSIPLQSLGVSVATPGFLETALEVAKGAKKAVDVIQIVNASTRQKSMVPRNAPVPAGWAVDSRWSPSLGDTGGKFVYDPGSGAFVIAQPEKPVDASVVAPAASTVPPMLALAVAAAAVFYLVK